MPDIAADILDQPQYLRANVNSIIATMEDHHARAIPISADLARAVPIIAGRLMQHDSARLQATGAKLVVAGLKHNLALYEFADKAVRLDNGSPTNIVDHTETSAALANPDAIRAAIEYDRAMRKPVANTAPAHLNGHLNGHANGHQNGTSNGSANGHAPHP